MFKKKKDDSNDPKVPFWKDYVRDPKGFKKYIIDRVVHLRSEGNANAVAFDLKGFKVAFPDDATPDSVSEVGFSRKAQPYVKTLMNTMAWEVFGPLFSEMGIDETLINKIVANQDNPSGKMIPGLNDKSSRESKLEDAASKVYSVILSTVSDAIEECVKLNTPDVLDGVIKAMDDAMRDATNDFDLPVEATDNIRDLREATALFKTLFDSDETTNEEYLSFLNKIIGVFVDDEVEATNKTTLEEHKDHSADDCQVAGVIHEMPPLQILYRRIHTTDEDADNENQEIPTLSLLVFDSINGVLHPIAFSIHEALTDKAGESFNRACRSEAGSKFLIGKVVDFIKQDEAKHTAYLELRKSDDDEMFAGAIRVAPEVVTPSVDVMKNILEEVRTAYGKGVQNVFDDLNPDDFK
jgi:hypothetical protein